MKKYQLLLIIFRREGVSQSLQTFSCKLSFQKAKQELDDWIGSNERAFRALYFDYEQEVSAEELFIEMLKANPFGDVRELMNKAKEAIELLKEIK